MVQNAYNILFVNSPRDASWTVMMSKRDFEGFRRGALGVPARKNVRQLDEGKSII